MQKKRNIFNFLDPANSSNMSGKRSAFAILDAEWNIKNSDIKYLLQLHFNFERIRSSTYLLIGRSRNCSFQKNSLPKLIRIK